MIVDACSSRDRAELKQALDAIRAGRPDVARALLEPVLEERPDLGVGWYLLAYALFEDGERERAIEHAKRAVVLAGELPFVLVGAGRMHQDLDRIEEAAALYERACAIDPMHENVLDVLLDLRLDRSEFGAYARALEHLRRVDGESAAVRVREANLFMRMGFPEDAYRAAMSAAEQDPACRDAFAMLCFASNYIDASRLDEGQRLGLHRAYARVLARDPPVAPPPRVRARPGRQGLIRVGFVSGDLREHPVAYFVRPVLANRPADVQVTLYADHQVHARDPMTAALRSLADRWRETHDLDESALAARVAADDNDVLVDLAGHTRRRCMHLLAGRLAPVQVSWLGYPNTTAMPCADFRLSGPFVDDGLERRYTEELVSLPDTFICYDGERGAQIPASRYRPAGSLRVGCFAFLGKLSAATGTLLGRIASRLPDARLVFKHNLIELGNLNLVEQKLERLGLTRDRWDMLERSATRGAYLSDFDRVDVLVDPITYNGTTITCEALSTGCPVITVPGATHASRVGGALLQACGLEEWIARDEADVIERLRWLDGLGDAARIEQRRRIRHAFATSALTDRAAFADAFYRCLRELVARAPGYL